MAAPPPPAPFAAPPPPAPSGAPPPPAPSGAPPPPAPSGAPPPPAPSGAPPPPEPSDVPPPAPSGAAEGGAAPAPAPDAAAEPPADAEKAPEALPASEPLKRRAAQPVKRGVQGIPGSRKALLAGVSYINTVEEVPGRERAVECVGAMLDDIGFRGERVTLRDDRGECLPTRRHLTGALWWLARDIEPGDAVFVALAGQSITLPEQGSGGRPEHAFCGCDYRDSGPVLQGDFHELFLRYLPNGAWVTFLCDFEHGGTLAPLPHRLALASPLEDNALQAAHDPSRTVRPGVDVTVIYAQGGNPVMQKGRSLTDCFVEVMHTFSGQTMTYQFVLEQLKERLNHGQDPVIATSKPKREDDVFHIGPLRPEEHPLERPVREKKVADVVKEELATDQGWMPVGEAMVNNQKAAHAALRKAMEDGIEQVQKEIAALQRGMEERRAEDAEREAKRAAEWEAECAGQKASDEKWRAMMSDYMRQSEKLLESRNEEADRWAGRLETYKDRLELESAFVHQERLRLMEEKKRHSRTTFEDWERTVGVVNSINKVRGQAVTCRDSVVPGVEAVLAETKELMATNKAIRERIAAAAATPPPRVLPPPPPKLDQRIAQAALNAQAGEFLPCLQAAELDYPTFLTMQSCDFARIGVTKLGARVKLAKEAARLSAMAVGVAVARDTAYHDLSSLLLP
eukprot:TRINITY_DN4053_c0_g1_i1.p1 TRINITY_DN4053_c0_g1~~TRINITY_DN4053_c0_g1_i1.p1  ORF type:complete len:696 (+),score=261.91 TRINITY_DN4053_c0_g1_i1:45-2090(+)